MKNSINTLLNDYSTLPIYCYGAAPSSVVNASLLSYDNKLAAYIDDNHLRHNLISPNVSIPVYPPDQLSVADECVVIIGACASPI